MKIVVTGARGFVGTALVTAAARSGHAGVATGRTAPVGLPPTWRGVGRDELLGRSVDGHRADAVIHLEVHQHAGTTTVDELEELDRVNVAGTVAWLDWATRQRIDRFVLASSVLAVTRSAGATDELALPETVSPYGASKARAEIAVRRWASESPSRRAVILRLAPVYGPDRRSNLIHFVTRVAAGRIALIGTGAARKSIVSRDNAAAALLHAATSAPPGVTVFNVADREAHSVRELAVAVARLTGAPPPRSVPLALARMAAPLADACGAMLGRDLPLSSARLRAATAPGYFPCDRLLASGFVHPQSTEAGLEAMIRGLGIASRSGGTREPGDVGE